jgi:hypothetical protein
MHGSPADRFDHVAEAHLTVAQAVVVEVAERAEAVVDAHHDDAAVPGQRRPVVPVERAGT